MASYDIVSSINGNGYDSSSSCGFTVTLKSPHICTLLRHYVVHALSLPRTPVCPVCPIPVRMRASERMPLVLPSKIRGLLPSLNAIRDLIPFIRPRQGENIVGCRLRMSFRSCMVSRWRRDHCSLTIRANRAGPFAGSIHTTASVSAGHCMLPSPNTSPVA